MIKRIRKTRTKNPWIQDHPAPKRTTKTAKERGEVTPEVYAAAMAYAGGCCIRCGWDPLQDPHDCKWKLEAAHYIRRHNFGQEGVQPWDILILCGPQVNSGTCHNWVDSTKEGKAWAIQKREEIRLDMLARAAALDPAPGSGQIRITQERGLVNIMEG